MRKDARLTIIPAKATDDPCFAVDPQDQYRPHYADEDSTKDEKGRPPSLRVGKVRDLAMGRSLEREVRKSSHVCWWSHDLGLIFSRADVEREQNHQDRMEVRVHETCMDARS